MPMRDMTNKKPIPEVSKTKNSLRVTRRGKALADVFPASPEAEQESWIDSMSDSIAIVGDIVSPIIGVEDIDALRNSSVPESFPTQLSPHLSLC
jgi:hypothetical protein